MMEFPPLSPPAAHGLFLPPPSPRVGRTRLTADCQITPALIPNTYIFYIGQLYWGLGLKSGSHRYPIVPLPLQYILKQIYHITCKLL